MSDYQDDRVSAKEAIELMRVQKHDFLNYMQVISGYLQLGKIDKAQYHLQKGLREIARSGTIMRLADPALGMNLLLRVHNAYREWGVNIVLSTSTELALVESAVFDRFLQKVIDAIGEIYANDPMQPQIQIDFSENDDDYSMVVLVLPFEPGAFSLLREKIEMAAVDLDCSLVNKSMPDTQDPGLELCFSKNARSG